MTEQRRPRARPTLSQTSPTVHLDVRISEADRAAIYAAAERAGLTASAWVRETLLSRARGGS